MWNLEDKMSDIKIDGKMMSESDFLKKVFPRGVQSITLGDIKNIAEQKPRYMTQQRLRAIRNKNSVVDFLNYARNIRIPIGKAAIKYLLVACLNDQHIVYDRHIVESMDSDGSYYIFKELLSSSDGNEDEKKEEFQEDFQRKPDGEEGDEGVNKKMDISFKNLLKIYNDVKLQGNVIKDTDIDVTEGKITEGMPVNLHDDFRFYFPAGLRAYPGCAALLSNDEKYIAAIGYLDVDPDKQVHLLFDREKIQYDLIKDNNQYKIILFPNEAGSFFSGKIQKYTGSIYLVPCKVTFRQLKNTSRTLCIDFGTSNTTVGSHGVLDDEQNKVEIVEFEDHTGDNVAYRKMMPTVIYVDKIEKDNEGKATITYSFGYEAVRKVISQDYDPVASVFYEIKRWINNLDGYENVSDENGSEAKVTHRELIKQYLDYVINTAERFFQRRFQTLHFTAPVKLKKSFIDAIQDMYRDEYGNYTYQVLPADKSLDEGIAVVYQHIAKRMELIKSQKNPEGGSKPQNILIIDCGGGTTDLARCTYQITRNQQGHRQLDITMSSENGDSNFGGNNITFRILQMIKIKLAKQLEDNRNVSMMELISNENEILDILDRSQSIQKGCQKIYSDFENAYAHAEALIPTQFSRDGLFLKQKRKMKRNFYYLWKMADAYKKQFYQTQHDVVAIDFNSDEDRALGIGNEEQYYLYIMKNGELEKVVNPLHNIKITIKEIECILYADIYALWKRILPIDDLVKEQYGCLYKLSGQSCKINLFHDLLKEFIPGRYLRYHVKGQAVQKNNEQDSQLKLDCIEGSIRYIRDQEEGRFEPVIHTKASQLFYSIYRALHDIDHPGEKDIPLLMRGNDANTIQVHVDWLPNTASRTEFAVFDQHQRRKHMINFEFGGNMNESKEVRVYDLQEDISTHTYPDLYGMNEEKIAEDITSQLESDKQSGYAIFLVPARSGYGFWVYLVNKKIKSDENGKQVRTFEIKKREYCSFEKEELVTFFDGKR